MSGYIGTQPVPQATQKRQAFTATAGQTTFATSGYSVGFVDVYMNGVKLAAADYTATNGSDVVLASAAVVNDIVEIVAFTSFVVNSGLLTTGGTMTGNLAYGDNVKAIFGAGSDLQIYHDGSNSYIKEDGTGVLKIQAADLELLHADGSRGIRVTNDGGPVLYNDGSSKLTVNSGGVAISGNITVTGNATFADNGKAIFGAGSDLQIYHDGSDSYIDDTNTGALILRGNSNVTIGKYTGETMGFFEADGAVSLYHNNAIKMATSASGISVTGTVAATAFTGDGSGLTGLGGGVPAGSVIYHAANTAPTGFLKANGAAVSRSTYSDLFTAIGTTFGSGDGSSTFNVPDLRGEFPRGWDDSRGIDSGRSFGSAQDDAFQGHDHRVPASSGAGGSYNYAYVGTGPFGTQNLKTTTILSRSGSGTARTASETRSRNIALLACIKY